MLELSEREVALRWRWGVRGRGRLVTAAGEAVVVLEPGRTSGAGPDFQGAVLLVQGQLQHGDVEVHCRASQWQGHRHHLDPRYNRVVLHAVLQADAATARRQDGAEVPVLPLPAGGEVPGCAAGHSPAAVAGHLERWGEERFRARAGEMACRLAVVPPGQVLYEGMMEALGYAANRQPFRRLARALPLRRLEAAGPGAGELLLTAAEGLPWRLSGLRPANHPRRRLLAMASLLARFQPPGLLGGITGLVASAATPGELERGLMVAGRPALLGGERVGEMAVNILLPFCFAYGGGVGPPGLSGHSLGLFHRYPLLPENGLTRHMKELLGLGQGVVTSARRQQGLHHLHRTWCMQGKCPRCPLPANSAP